MSPGSSELEDSDSDSDSEASLLDLETRDTKFDLGGDTNIESGLLLCMLSDMLRESPEHVQQALISK